jgi:hypothetical protein
MKFAIEVIGREGGQRSTDWSAGYEAENAAWSAPGVKSVHDRLSVG